MKKFLLAASFCLIFSTTSQAAVRSIVGQPPVSQKKPLTLEEKQNRKMPTYESLEDLLEDRGDNLMVSIIPPEELNSSTTQNFVPSAEHAEMIKNNNKSYFQQVYENAVNRASSSQANYSQNILTPPSMNNLMQQQQAWQRPNYPTVLVTLPSGKKILAPAIEHIPYFLSDISLFPNGTAQIKEKVIVVANDQKLKYGLQKSLPKYSTSRDGNKNKIDINLETVKINGQEIEYKLEEVGNTVFIVPKENFELQPGIYTFDFEYIINNHLWVYDDFNEFYWNLTGNSWNLIIARAGAIIRLPGTDKELGKVAFIQSTEGPNLKNISIFDMEDNTIGLASIGPVFAGESLETVVSIPKSSFTATTNDWLTNLINNYGDIILSAFCLIVVLAGYLFSLKGIHSDKNLNKRFLSQKNAATIRYIEKGKFDKVAFGAFLLELFKQKIIDIKKDNSIISIEKKYDSSENLSKNEKKSIRQLFVGKDAILQVDKSARSRFVRAYNSIKQDTESKMRMFMLKANVGYISFSFLMLFLSQIAIALLTYSPLKNFLMMACLDVLITLCVAVILLKSKSIAQYFYKPISLAILCASVVILGVIVQFASVFLILATIISIFVFTFIFSGKNGFLKRSVEDIERMKKNLNEATQNSMSERDFIARQPVIFALDLSNKFEDFYLSENANKLKLIEEIIKEI